MKKVIFMCFIIFAFFNFNGLIYASQNDIYGTWFCFESVNNRFILTKIVISSSSLYIEKGYIDTSTGSGRIDSTYTFSDGETFEITILEIIDWLESINDDTGSREVFPNGFILTIKDENGNNSSFSLYFNNNRRIGWLSINDSIGQLIFKRS